MRKSSFMNQSQQELRRAASQAFIESLEQLSQRLESPDGELSEDISESSIAPPLNHPPQPPVPEEDAQFDLKALEEAVEDIEQFMQSQRSDN
jgi:small-conductance mechanosensitive channel